MFGFLKISNKKVYSANLTIKAIILQNTRCKIKFFKAVSSPAHFT
jgi:hypothetical protein